MQKELEVQLAKYRDPLLNKTLFELKAIKNIHEAADGVTIDIELGYPCQSMKKSIVADIQAILTPLNFPSISINISQKITGHTGSQSIPGLAEIKNIIVVGSGKGGVGKSTVALNIATALLKEGVSVGLLDADVYGPSLPTLLDNLDEKPAVIDKILQPIMSHGLQTMSIGYLVDKNAPIAWRGPMLGKAMQQMINDTAWKNLDYLIVDLPPGTGDVQLSLCQKIPLSGAVIVTTPQDLALSDVVRACEMFQNLKVPLLGVVENMSLHTCSQCGHEEEIFGHGGGNTLSHAYRMPLLGQLPLTKSIAKDQKCMEVFSQIALKAAAQLTLQNKNYSGIFPKIVVEQRKS